MGLLKTKPILFSDSFQHSKDPFYADNAKYKATSKASLPNSTKDLMVKKSQAVFFTVDNVLQKLLDNDRYINSYIQKIQNVKVDKSRVIEAFKQDVPVLSSDAYETAFQRHLDIHHSKSSKFMQLSEVYNKRLRTDFSNFDVDSAREKFLKSSSYEVDTSDESDLSSFSQDVVVNVEYDDQVNCPTNYIAVYVCNDQTDGQFSTTLSRNIVTPVADQIPPTTETKYIYREWLSGIKEFFIYIPSTFTFYTEKLGENGTTGYSDESKLLTPHTRATWIKMVMNKRHFKLSHVFTLEINGQSLPLQIHADQKSYFNDCPQPSIVRSVCMSNDRDNNTDCIYDEDTNMFTFSFCCYGTDAQAVRIVGN